MGKTERRQWANGGRQAGGVGALRGVTLTEVLMAILIAGIGLVAVVTLFPIAILRSVQATQLTNATILRFNAEAMIDVLPQIVDDPDGDLLLSSQVLPDPLDPRTDVNQPPPYGHRPYIEHFSERYIVDPVGWWVIGKDYLQSRPQLRLWFGNDGASPPNPVQILRRYNAGLNPIPAAGNPQNWATLSADRTAQAYRLATLPDSWVLQWEGTPVATTAVSVELPSTFDVSNFPAGQSRIVLFDPRNGRSGQVRAPVTVSSASPPVLSWTVPLPADLANNVDRVRIETHEYRYTWLLTVRKNPYGDGDVDVVVVFRRAFSLEEEFVYDATFIHRQNHAWVQFRCTHTGQLRTLPEPFVKRGSFILDVANARWYRIVDYEMPAPDAPYALRVTLDRPALETAGDDTDLDDSVAPNERFGAAVFMRGVVEVYPIGRRGLPKLVFEQLTAP